MLSVMSPGSPITESPTTPSKMGLGFLLNNKDLSKKRQASASYDNLHDCTNLTTISSFGSTNNENLNPNGRIAGSSLSHDLKRRLASTGYTTTSATTISLPPLSTSVKPTTPNRDSISAVLSRYSPIQVDYAYKTTPHPPLASLQTQQFLYPHGHHPTEHAYPVPPMQPLQPVVASSVTTQPPSTCYSSPIQQHLPNIVKSNSLPAINVPPATQRQQIICHNQQLAPPQAAALQAYQQHAKAIYSHYPSSHQQYYEQHTFSTTEPYLNSQQHRHMSASQPPQSAPSYYYYPDTRVHMQSPSAIVHQQPVQEYAIACSSMPLTSTPSASLSTAALRNAARTTGNKSLKKSNSKLNNREERRRRLQMALQDLNNGYFKNIHSAASTYEVNYNSLKNAYYKINGKDENSQRLTTEEREIRIKRAIKGFQEGKYANLTVASKFEKVCAETVRNRYHGRTQSFSVAKRNR